MGSKGTGKPEEMLQFQLIRNTLQEVLEEDACLSIKEKTPRERLIAKLKEKGINVTDYAKEKGLSGRVPDSRFEELLKELG